MLREQTTDDRGFTLIELLITVTITSIIIFPLCAMVITFLTNSESVRSRQYESKDQQIAAQYWSSDVASIGTRANTTFAAGDGINTGDCTPYPGTKLVSLRWTTFGFTTATPPAVTSALTSITYSLSGTKLTRTSCAGSGPQSTTIANTVLADPTHPLQCSTDGQSYGLCSSMSGSGATGLYLKFYVADPSGKGDGYWATLVGERRQTP